HNSRPGATGKLIENAPSELERSRVTGKAT
ncbi:hypothetical protein PMI21_02232, partial [Pseudomonas sp. GM18]